MFSGIRIAFSLLCFLGLSLARAQGVTQGTPQTLPHPRQGPSDLPLERSNEDWSTIELARSRLPLQSIGGVLISKVDLPGCTRELLRMQWRPNDPIDLYITRPRGDAKLPVVLFLYNYTVDTDVFRQDGWCERATRNGFAAVGFPTALSWQRLRAPRPMKEWFVSELPEALASSAHDVQMVLNYLASRKDLDVHRTGVFGQGSGGAIAILAAAADPRIASLDLMDPWGDWPDWLQGSKQIPEEERATYLEPQFLEKVAGLDPITYLPRLTTTTIRIQQTSDDLVTPESARAKLEAAAPSSAKVTRYTDIKTEAKALGPDGIIGWLGAQVAIR